MKRIPRRSRKFQLVKQRICPRFVPARATFAEGSSHAMPKIRMSPTWIAGLSTDDDAEWIDTEQRGLVLRVRRGQMVWFVRYLFEGEARRHRIGEHPETGLSGARKLASVVRGRAAAGDDLQADRRAKREAARRRRLGETVGGALASWLKDRKHGPLGRWRGGLEGGSASASLPHIRRLDRMLGKKLLSDVTPSEMEKVVAASEAPATRNRALCALRGFLGWAIRSGLVDNSPTALTRRGTCPSRRALTTGRSSRSISSHRRTLRGWWCASSTMTRKGKRRLTTFTRGAKTRRARRAANRLATGRRPGDGQSRGESVGAFYRGCLRTRPWSHGVTRS